MSIAKISALYKAVAQRYKSFANKLEMNDSLAAHIFATGRKLHKNARAVLDMHAKHSCIVTGVSWLNPATVATTLGIHERTVQRAYERLESFGIIYRETVELGGMTPSFLVIRPFGLSSDCLEFVHDLSQEEGATEPVVPTDEAAFSPDEPVEPVETKNIIDNSNIRKGDETDLSAHLDESFTPGNVPEVFIKAVAPFYRSAKAIYELWGKVRLAAKGIILDFICIDGRNGTCG